MQHTWGRGWEEGEGRAQCPLHALRIDQCFFFFFLARPAAAAAVRGLSPIQQFTLRLMFASTEESRVVTELQIPAHRLLPNQRGFASVSWVCKDSGGRGLRRGGVRGGGKKGWREDTAVPCRAEGSAGRHCRVCFLTSHPRLSSWLIAKVGWEEGRKQRRVVVDRLWKCQMLWSPFGWTKESLVFCDFRWGWTEVRLVHRNLGTRAMLQSVRGSVVMAAN